MTFIEFLNRYDYVAWLLVAVIIIAGLAYLIKFIFHIKNKKHEVKSNLPTEAELMETLKSLGKPKVKSISIKAEKKIKIKEPKIKSKLISDEIKDTEIKSFSPIKSKSKFSYGYWRAWFLDKYFPTNIVLVHMELTNGFHRQFIVKEKDEGFVFKSKKYLFDDESKYYNIDAKLYTFDYHENITLPIKRKIPVSAIKKTLESLDEIDIEYAVNPSTLQRFMTAKIAEGVMKGTQLDAFMQKLNMFILVIMITVLVHLVLFLYASGILQNIKLPF